VAQKKLAGPTDLSQHLRRLPPQFLVDSRLQLLGSMPITAPHGVKDLGDLIHGVILRCTSFGVKL
jgi:hypothetical protein